MEEPIGIDNNNIESISQQQLSTGTNIDINSSGNVLYLDKDMWWKLLYTMFTITAIGYLMAKRTTSKKFIMVKPIPVIILGYIVLLWCSIQQHNKSHHHQQQQQQQNQNEDSIDMDPNIKHMFSLIIPNNPTKYAIYISAGLFLSAIGDFFLLYKRFFMHGVMFFLVAHISFIFAFTSSDQFFTPTVVGMLVGIVLLFVYMFLAKVFPLFSKMGISKSLAVALLFYTSVIVTMCFTASVKSFLKLITIINNATHLDMFSNLFSSFSFYASIGAIGAVLFFVSDLMILVREVNQLANGQVSTIRKLLGHGDLGMIVYWLGQFCIALSVTEF